MERALVYGPPGAGKSTFARTLGFKVLEREQFPSDAAFKRAVRAHQGEVAVVRCCFGVAELEEWRELVGATYVRKVNPGLSECKRRIHARGHRGWRGEIVAAERWTRSWTGQTLLMPAPECEPVTSRSW